MIAPAGPMPCRHHPSLPAGRSGCRASAGAGGCCASPIPRWLARSPSCSPCRGTVLIRAVPDVVDQVGGEPGSSLEPGRYRRLDASRSSPKSCSCGTSCFSRRHNFSIGLVDGVYVSSTLARPNSSPRRTSVLTALGAARTNGLPLELWGALAYFFSFCARRSDTPTRATARSRKESTRSTPKLAYVRKRRRTVVNPA